MPDDGFAGAAQVYKIKMVKKSNSSTSDSDGRTSPVAKYRSFMREFRPNDQFHPPLCLPPRHANHRYTYDYHPMIEAAAKAAAAAAAGGENPGLSCSPRTTIAAAAAVAIAAVAPSTAGAVTTHDTRRRPTEPDTETTGKRPHPSIGRAREAWA